MTPEVNDNQISFISIIESLAFTRPIFHSEADFQHALAWELHQHYPDSKIRLEINPFATDQRAYLDILLELDNKLIAIELKYKTRKLEYNHAGEEFRLLNQSATDIGRYDFIKDIVRLERFVDKFPSSKGVAIILTNDKSYYDKPVKDNQVDKDFRIHADKILKGELKWGTLASSGTMRGREKDLVLAGEHVLEWRSYSSLTDSSSGQFKYLLVPIG